MSSGCAQVTLYDLQNNNSGELENVNSPQKRDSGDEENKIIDDLQNNNSGELVKDFNPQNQNSVGDKEESVKKRTRDIINFDDDDNNKKQRQALMEEIFPSSSSEQDDDDDEEYSESAKSTTSRKEVAEESVATMIQEESSINGDVEQSTATNEVEQSRVQNPAKNYIKKKAEKLVQLMKKSFPPKKLLRRKKLIKFPQIGILVCSRVINSKKYYKDLFQLIWPDKNILNVTEKMVKDLRPLFYSIFSESLEKKDKKMFRLFENLSTPDFNKTIDENKNVSGEEVVKLKSDRKKINKIMQNKFTKLMNAFRERQTEAKATTKAASSDSNASDDEVNIIENKKQRRNHKKKKVIPNDEGSDEASENSNDEEDFIFQEEDEDEDSDDDNESEVTEISTNKKDSGKKKNIRGIKQTGAKINDLSQEENKDLSRKGYLYIVAGGFENSPPFVKIGGSSAIELHFYSRSNHYWVGFNPRFCFRYGIPKFKFSILFYY
jgi:hypothetical protein